MNEWQIFWIDTFISWLGSKIAMQVAIFHSSNMTNTLFISKCCEKALKINLSVLSCYDIHCDAP